MGSPSQKRGPPPSPPQRERKKRKSMKTFPTTVEKLDRVFDLLQSMSWTIGELLHHLFVWTDPRKDGPKRSSRHGLIVKKYLSGTTKYGVSEVLDHWFTSPDGKESEESAKMWSTDVPFTDIKPVRSALSSFAAQVVKTRLVDEARVAIRPSSGLHASVNSKTEVGKVVWADLGTALIPNVQAILKRHQPLTYHYMLSIATPKLRRRGGEHLIPRTYRPPDLVGLFKYSKSLLQQLIMQTLFYRPSSRHCHL